MPSILDTIKNGTTTILRVDTTTTPMVPLEVSGLGSSQLKTVIRELYFRPSLDMRLDIISGTSGSNVQDKIILSTALTAGTSYSLKNAFMCSGAGEVLKVRTSVAGLAAGSMGEPWFTLVLEQQ